MSDAPANPLPKTKPLSGPQKALRKLGLLRPIDFALHLPLRYEDETKIVKLCDVHDGDMAQIEGIVRSCEVRQSGHRQLLVTLDDGSETCLLRFFSFYPSQQKALAVGNRIRARGEVRGGFAGLTMMHPTFQAAGAALPVTLTPVYSSVAGLPQSYLRRAVQNELARAELHELGELENLYQIDGRTMWTLRQALLFLHHPAPDVTIATLEDRSHPAWQRLKADELLAQQLSQLQARLARAHLRAPALTTKANLTISVHQRLLCALPFTLTRAQRRV